jgi:hypothetical protein
MIYILIMKKDSQFLIRLSPLEKEGFERAAQIAGIGLSTWARERLRSAAIKELQNNGEKIIFLEAISLKYKENGR